MSAQSDDVRLRPEQQEAARHFREHHWQDANKRHDKQREEREKHVRDHPSRIPVKRSSPAPLETSEARRAHLRTVIRGLAAKIARSGLYDEDYEAMVEDFEREGDLDVQSMPDFVIVDFLSELEIDEGMRAGLDAVSEEDLERVIQAMKAVVS